MQSIFLEVTTFQMFLNAQTPQGQKATSPEETIIGIKNLQLTSYARISFRYMKHQEKTTASEITISSRLKLIGRALSEVAASYESDLNAIAQEP